MRDLFLAGARVVASALADPRVADAWDRPSVLEHQTVGSLAGHLARGGVWVVADYLAVSAPGECGALTFESAAAYYAGVFDRVTAADAVAIRERAAAVAAKGPRGVSAELQERIGTLEDDLPARPEDARIVVIGGAVMDLDEYLASRLVEQVVHLDDLGRSIGDDGAVAWPPPPEAVAVVLELGLAVATHRCGTTAVLRALYRRGFSDILPVLR